MNAPLPAQAEDAYSLFQRGQALIAAKDWPLAVPFLEQACDLEPDKSSIREELARAYFCTQQYRAAAAEFLVVIELYPTNDYAHFCLGRSLEMMGKYQDASRHYSLACAMSPKEAEYLSFRDRNRERLSRSS